MAHLLDTGNATRTASSPDILLFPGDPGWDDARRAWNLAVDQRPAAVALPETVEDVVAVVEHARLVGLDVAVQGTGHGASAPLSGALLVNTSRMTGVEIDPAARVARVAAGAVWGDVVEAAAEHGLTGLHGSAADVGVVGYSLGGGIGWLARKHGLASSSVLSAEVVTANGEVVRAGPDTNPELLWALRGGGGSFGVVTEVEIALHPVAEVYAGWLIWPAVRAAQVLTAWAEWTREAPEEVTSVGRLLQIPSIPEAPEPLRGRQLVVVEGVFLGDEADGSELLAPLRALEPELDTFATVPARALTELHRDPPGPVPGRGGGAMLDRLDANAVRALVSAAGMDGTSPLGSLEVRHLGGALGRPDPHGALSHFEAPYAVFTGGAAASADAAAAVDARLEALRSALSRWLSRSAYYHVAEPGVEPSSLYPEGTYDRLVRIRREMDPEGLFRTRHTID
jgi:FAD/FMN-containing dehydrogenase